MSLPKTTASYPPEMMQALLRAHETGEVIIPTLTPMAMRLQFNGLRGALRKEGQGELADMVSFHIGEDKTSFIIRLRAASPIVSDIAKALGTPENQKSSTATEEAEASLARILGGGE